MKIVRNGIEYELTRTELYDAYRECQRSYFIEDIKAMAEEMEQNLDGVDIERLVDHAEHAYNNDDCLWDCYWRDIEYALEDI